MNWILNFWCRCVTMATDSAPEMWTSPDASFSKKIVKCGSGFWSPNDGASCRVCITPLGEAGDDVLLLGYTLGERHITMGEGCGVFSNVLDACLETMHRGEECEVFIRDNCNLRTDEDASTSIRPTSEGELDHEARSGTLGRAFHVVLHDFTRSKDVYEMSDEEKLERAEWHKNHGTVCFKGGNHKLAERFYIKALRYVISVCLLPNRVPPLNDQTRERYYCLKRTCSLNLAACQLRSQRYEDVVKHCNCALEKDRTNIKALFRRCQAYIALNEFESARVDIQLGLSQEPKNKMILEQNRILIKREKQAYGKLSVAMNKMFGGPSTT